MSTINLDEATLATLRHILGVDEHERYAIPYRDHYALPDDDPEMGRLASLGLVKRSGRAWGLTCWQCTLDGHLAATRSPTNN